MYLHYLNSNDIQLSGLIICLISVFKQKEHIRYNLFWDCDPWFYHVTICCQEILLLVIIA